MAQKFSNLTHYTLTYAVKTDVELFLLSFDERCQQSFVSPHSVGDGHFQEPNRRDRTAEEDEDGRTKPKKYSGCKDKYCLDVLYDFWRNN